MEFQNLHLREITQQYEAASLSPFATQSVASRGRRREEEECDLRTPFQRDRDRVLHSKSFRRLMHKTQVFIQPEGDHYRTRLTHTLEVAQIARTISRALRLNEDLTEAIALAHDLGHTPFGHAGERVLNRVMPEGFTHEKQGVRVAEVLEKDGKGLNLTWEVLDGIANHSISSMPATMEGQVIRLADKMAYIHHDIDDAIRGQILTEDELPLESVRVLGFDVKERLNHMIRDCIVNSMGQPKVSMTPEIEQAMMELRKYMFEHVYIGSAAKSEEGKAEQVIAQLIEHYQKYPERMPKVYYDKLRKGGDLNVIITDYVSGMTDHYAVNQYNTLFLPKGWHVY